MEEYEAEAEGEEGGRGRAGVVVNGGRMEADIVVGADGVKSAARKLVLVSFPRQRPSLTGSFVPYFLWSANTLMPLSFSTFLPLKLLMLLFSCPYISYLFVF